MCLANDSMHSNTVKHHPPKLNPSLFKVSIYNVFCLYCDTSVKYLLALYFFLVSWPQEKKKALALNRFSDEETASV